MKTLILGCGYLGLFVGRMLRERGETVFGTVRSTSSAQRLLDLGIEPILADVLDPQSFSKWPPVDRMLYCVGFDRASGIPMRTVYVDGLKNVLNHLPETCQRLVYAGSTSVYGQTDGDWMTEDSPTEPISEAGRIGLDAEQLFRSHAREHGLHAIIVRFVGLYGPGRILRRAALERAEAIQADPTKYLNLIHIEDAARVAVAALDRGQADQIYLASDDRPIQRGEYYQLAAELVGAPAPRFEPLPVRSEATRAEANRKIKNQRMKVDLGVSLKYPDIQTGLPAALLAESKLC